MSDMVLVSRKDLELAVDDWWGSRTADESQSPLCCCEHAAEARLRAGLESDPAVLEEQIARAIYSTVGYYSWDDYGDKESYRESARAVLASIGEGER